MNLNDIHRVCQSYNKLGTAVQDQLRQVLEYPSEETFCECNVNALAMIHEFFTEIAFMRDEDVSCDAQGIAEEILEYVEDEPGHTIHYGRIVNR